MTNTIKGGEKDEDEDEDEDEDDDPTVPPN